MDVSDRVIANLKEFGLRTDVKPAILKHLIKIDEVLFAMNETRSEAIRDIKKSKITVKRVSEESGISRQTFYNNKELNTYIEAYISKFVVESPFETIEKLREEIRMKDNQIACMLRRDATISKCRAQNKELTDEIASLRETIASQEELIRQLRFSRTNLSVLSGGKS